MKVKKFLSHLKLQDKIILSDQGRHLTGREFVTEVELAAEQLQALGVSQGTPVLIRLNNTVSSVVSLFSIWACGGFAFIGNPFDPSEKTVKLIRKFGIYMLISDKASIKTVQHNFSQEISSELPTLCNSDLYIHTILSHNKSLQDIDIRMSSAQVAIFSSGTTGEPKAILNSFENICMNAKLHAKAVGLKGDDVIGIILPIYYSYGLVANLLAGLLSGCHVVFQPKLPTVNEDWARSTQITVMGLTPHFAQFLNINVPTLRVLTFGGDVLYTGIAKIIKQKFSGCELYGTYGLTEAGPRVATWRFDCSSIPSTLIAPIGTPLDGFKLQIENNEGMTNQGELVVTSSTRMLGYYFGVEDGFETPMGVEGRVNTGDIFKIIDGDFYFVSRDKDIIVQNGEKLYPPVIESIIRNIDGVVDVRVDGVFDKEKGQIAKALVHATEHVTVKQIKQALLRQVSHASLPTIIELVNGIARTETGKKLRGITAAA